MRTTAVSSWLRLPRPRAAADGESAAARWLRPALVLAVLGALTATAFLATNIAPVDSYLYYQTAHATQIYGTVWGTSGDALFVYPPPLVNVVRVLSIAGWAPWLLIWTTLLAVCYACVRWVGVLAVIIGFVGSATSSTVLPIAVPGGYLFIGNVQALIMAAIVLGLRYPAMWAVPLLTKIGPGIGILWFAVRGEWRNLAIAVGATAAIAAVSLAIDFGAWGDWVRFVFTNVGTPSPIPVVPIPGWIRFPAAILLIVWGARTNRPWVLPIACGICSFALYEWSYLAIWLGAFAFVGPWAPREPDGRLSLAGRPA
jgi:hypothetical protein